jgi:hypothetical protein
MQQQTARWIHLLKAGAGGFFLGVKAASAKVKKTWIYTSTPTKAFMVLCLVKHRDNFIHFFPYRQVRKVDD